MYNLRVNRHDEHNNIYTVCREKRTRITGTRHTTKCMVRTIILYTTLLYGVSSGAIVVVTTCSIILQYNGTQSQLPHIHRDSRNKSHHLSYNLSFPGTHIIIMIHNVLSVDQTRAHRIYMLYTRRRDI